MSYFPHLQLNHAKQLHVHVDLRFGKLALFPQGKKKKGKSILQVPDWNVPVLVNTGTFLVYPVLLETVIFTSFRTCWCHSEAYNTGAKNGLVLSNTRVPVSGT